MSLAYPTVSDSDYFTGWALNTSAFIGSETLTTDADGACWIALYNQNGKLLALRQCSGFQWSANPSAPTTMYLAPNFTEAELSDAAYAKRFYVNSSWTPSTAAEQINQSA
jgi:hypothetical protein